MLLQFMDLCGFLLSALQRVSLFGATCIGVYYKIIPINLCSWNWWLKPKPKDVQTPRIVYYTVNFKYQWRNNIFGLSQEVLFK